MGNTDEIKDDTDKSILHPTEANYRKAGGTEDISVSHQQDDNKMIFDNSNEDLLNHDLGTVIYKNENSTKSLEKTIVNQSSVIQETVVQDIEPSISDLHYQITDVGSKEEILSGFSNTCVEVQNAKENMASSSNQSFDIQNKEEIISSSDNRAIGIQNKDEILRDSNNEDIETQNKEEILRSPVNQDIDVSQMNDEQQSLSNNDDDVTLILNDNVNEVKNNESITDDRTNNENNNKESVAYTRAKRKSNIPRKYKFNDTESDTDDDEDYNENETNDKKRADKPGGKLLSNIHQCYVCFKLYKTKDELLDHCEQHFDVCNRTMLRKCPLCDHVADKNMRRHLKLKHNIKTNLRTGHIKDRKDNSGGSRFYYESKSNKFDKMEIIPSVKNLNREAYMDLDKKRRESNITTVQKKKLVKKGKEWIVMKERVNIDNYVLPQFDSGDTEIGETDDYCQKLKNLSRVAKKKGHKMMYPCDKCVKICQTLSALKLHYRTHDPNPKPYKPKVWKHKLKLDEEKPKKGKTGNKISKLNKSINDKQNIETSDGSNKNKTNNNRFLDPKPVVNKHKCDPKLIKFYKNNIKGGDIEFWQFLKIYNRLTREKIDNFEDLENRTDFGLQIKMETIKENKVGGTVEKESDDKPCKEKRDRGRVQVKKNRYKRKIMLSKKEYEKRNELKKKLRENIINT
ncbi:protein PFC0760c-like [Leptidea sinapis]|uniref:protein PFC0760c-like n=1 Tax=Leptidea sinapis TaxID=189913 RepID=UPI0021C35145|nr:protein PFC0760c-like [Leptidea sinapis]